MNKILIPAALAIGLIGGYLLFQARAPVPDGCNVTDLCELKAPDGLDATFEQTTLKLNWQAVEGAKYYLVSVIDINSVAPLPAIVRKTSETSLTLSDSAIVENRTYRTTVTAVCNNCSVSLKNASIDACSIVFDELVQLNDPCRAAGCNCTNTSPVPGATPNSFNVGATKELHKVTITCGLVTKWFILQTEFVGGKLMVKIPQATELGNNCLGISNYDGPVESGCGILSNFGPDYTINITPLTSGGATFSLSTGCSWTVVKCNGCAAPNL